MNATTGSVGRPLTNLEMQQRLAHSAGSDLALGTPTVVHMQSTLSDSSGPTRQPSAVDTTLGRSGRCSDGALPQLSVSPPLLHPATAPPPLLDLRRASSQSARLLDVPGEGGGADQLDLPRLVLEADAGRGVEGLQPANPEDPLGAMAVSQFS